MARRHIDDSTPTNSLVMPDYTGGVRGYIPRDIPYGDPQNEAMGGVPMGDYPDDLIDPSDFKEVIQDCHDRQLFPMYHEEDHGMAVRWNQNGLPYCWAWSATIALMNIRQAAGKAAVALAPTSLGWLVNWSSSGYYLNRTIAGAKERGIASTAFVPDIHSRNPRTFVPGWEDDALKYRTGEWWDGQPGSDLHVIRQCLTILRTGSPIYLAYNWWGHALCGIGMLFDETKYLNVVFIIRNSHGEIEPIELSGNRMVPDEHYGLRMGSLAG